MNEEEQINILKKFIKKFTNKKKYCINEFHTNCKVCSMKPVCIYYASKNVLKEVDKQ